jgi:hypothetical protein
VARDLDTPRFAASITGGFAAALDHRQRAAAL